MSCAGIQEAATTVTLKVPAKLNLHLQAGLLRDDGYHDMTTVYQAISIYDTLKISLMQNEALHGFTMDVTGVDSDRIPADAENLVIKAAQRLSDYVAMQSKSTPNLHFELVKTIPAQAGLGGGSADAAAALVGCNILWKAGVCQDDLMALGAQIGEDVPFFIKGMVALGMGHKAPLVFLDTTQTSTWHWVLGILPAGLSTKEVFGRFEEFMNMRGFDGLAYRARHEACMQKAWGSTPPEILAAALVNDLEEASAQLQPGVSLALQAGEAAGALASLMAGAGSTCAFLAGDQEHAINLAVKLEEEKLFKDVIRVVGPVEGVKIC
ncbi:4-diphosphocytidyl-2C-methyl-D-erythritol kinase [Stipitochalara longipes BDJ]|nr:4-diphosphocytidyl-2C-methyl-D-erythritol kinase [Stipitochalara longipes BDJ]